MATYKYRIIRRVVECDGLDEDDAERVIAQLSTEKNETLEKEKYPLDDMGVKVSILDIEIEVPNHNYISSVEDVHSKSLVAIMYPLHDDLEEKTNMQIKKALENPLSQMR